MSPRILDQPVAAGEQTIETEVLIIGGGVTGTGIMRDLALRGLHTLLIDKRDLCAGASGGNHGLLHSGARYVSNDLHSAIECRVENELLKRLAPQCIEETGGMFVAVQGDDPEFAEKFPQYCAAAGYQLPGDQSRRGPETVNPSFQSNCSRPIWYPMQQWILFDWPWKT